MDHRLSDHLPAAIILLAAAVVATAASRAAGTDVAPPSAAGAFGDLPRFMTRSAPDSGRAPAAAILPRDPLLAEPDVSTKAAVARTANARTVRPTDAGRRLTALLIADERRVAVIDDTLVSVGAVLRDGSRVSAIQPGGVWIIEKNGKWRLLTLVRGER